ncbi:MAG: GSCFA domain-containing protein [Bacteroidaceae bacterium]|nr:GSCFA domain-containing protein [Bacteroidaceae bacterium]
MQLLTPTHISPLHPALRHSDRVVVMGSCFAEHIGARLSEMKWRTVVNPFGVLYNPLSIAEAMGRLISARPYTEEELTLYPHGGWSTWMHHSRYAHPDKETALQLINGSLAIGSQMLAQADMLIVTLGTAWVYRQKETNQVVGNCHKVPERTFTRQRLTVEETVEAMAAMLAQLWEVNPSLRMIITVSPVRHLKDTLHGNQLSKATLLLAVDELCRRFPDRVHYFPAYEIVMDELRDYRFYADDMAHPSPQAVEYVWERFVEHMTHREAQDFMTQWTKVARALAHRPFHPEGEEYKEFVRQNMLRIMELKEKYPYLEVQNEIDTCHTLLKP